MCFIRRFSQDTGRDRNLDSMVVVACVIHGFQLATQCSLDTMPVRHALGWIGLQHKEPKLDMAKRVISGPLFKETWVELDAEVRAAEDDRRGVHEEGI